MNHKAIFTCLGMLLLLLSIVGVCIFVGIIETLFSDSLTNFQKPVYIPEGYVSSNNDSTSNDKAFYFKDNETNQFMVAAIKNTNQSKLTELQNPLTNPLTENKNINVNGHNITFQTLKMDFMGLHMNLFHASWTCNTTGLTIIVMGKMKDNETEEMKKNENIYNMPPPKRTMEHIWNKNIPPYKNSRLN